MENYHDYCKNDVIEVLIFVLANYEYFSGRLPLVEEMVEGVFGVKGDLVDHHLRFRKENDPIGDLIIEIKQMENRNKYR